MPIGTPDILAKFKGDISNFERAIVQSSLAAGKFAEQMASHNKTMAAEARRAYQAEMQKVRALRQAAAARRRQVVAIERATREIRRSTKAAEQQNHSFSSFSKTLGTSITLWYTARTAIYAFRNAVEDVISIYRKGIEALDEFKTSVIGVSAVMIPYVKEGTTAVEKMELALRHNTEAFKDMEIVAAKHIATGKSLQMVYEALAVSGVFASKEDIDNVAKLADFITLYTKGQRLEVQLIQEIRGLMDGQVRAQNRLAYTLDRLLGGSLKEYVEKWKEAGRDQKGQLVVLSEIVNRLGNIDVLQGEILNTVGAWKNTLITIGTRLLRESVVQAHSDIVSLLKRVVGYVYDLETGYTRQGRILQSIIREGWLKIRDVAEGFLGTELRNINQVMDELLAKSQKFVFNLDGKKIGEQLRAGFEIAKEAVEGLFLLVKAYLVYKIPYWAVKAGEALLAALAGRATIAEVAGLWGLVTLVVYELAKAYKEAAKESETLQRINEKLAPIFERLAKAMSNLYGAEVGLGEGGRTQFIRRPIAFPRGAKYPEILERHGARAIAPPPSMRPAGPTFVTPDKWFEKYKEELEDTVKKEKELTADDWITRRIKGREEALENLYKAQKALWQLTEKERRRREEIDRIVAEGIEEEKKRRQEELDQYVSDLGEYLAQQAKLAEERASLQKTWHLEVIRLTKGELEAKKEALKEEEEAIREKFGNDLELLKLYHKYRDKLLEEEVRKDQLAKAEMLSNTFSNLSETFRLQGQYSKKWFRMHQAMAVSQIIVDTSRAIMATLAKEGWWAYALAGSIAALGAAQIATVLRQEPPTVTGLAEGGVSPGGFKSLAETVLSKPTYVVAERQGRPEAVVPLDKYDISRKGKGGGAVVVGDRYQVTIMAVDAKSLWDMYTRNRPVFEGMIVEMLRSGKSNVKAAARSAVR